jgi:hypothetical protein
MQSEQGIQCFQLKADPMHASDFADCRVNLMWLYERLQVRDFLLNKLYQLRKPKTNVSIIQQTILLKYKYFVRFLRDHGVDIFQEVRGMAGVLCDRSAASARSGFPGKMGIGKLKMACSVLVTSVS